MCNRLIRASGCRSALTEMRCTKRRNIKNYSRNYLYLARQLYARVTFCSHARRSDQIVHVLAKERRKGKVGKKRSTIDSARVRHPMTEAVNASASFLLKTLRSRVDHARGWMEMTRRRCTASHKDKVMML